MSGVTISKTKVSMAILLYIEEIANKDEQTRVGNSQLDRNTGLIEGICFGITESNNLSIYLDEVIKGLEEKMTIRILDKEEFKEYITRRVIFETSTQLKVAFTGTSYFNRYSKRFTAKVNNSNRGGIPLSEDEGLRILASYIIEHTDNIKFSSNMLSEIDQSLVMMNRSTAINMAKFSSNRTEQQREAMKSSVSDEDYSSRPAVIPYKDLENLVSYNKVSYTGRDGANYNLNDFISDIVIEDIDRDFAKKSSLIKFTRNIDHKYAKDYWDRQLKSYTSAIRSNYGYADKSESYKSIIENIKSDGASGCNDKSAREIGSKDADTQDLIQTLKVRGYRSISNIIRIMKESDEPFNINFDELSRIGLDAFPIGEDIELDKISELLDVHSRVIKESRRQSNIDEASRFRDMIGDNLLVDTSSPLWFKNINSNELIMECQNLAGRGEEVRKTRELDIHKSYIGMNKLNRAGGGMSLVDTKEPFSTTFAEDTSNKVRIYYSSDLASSERLRYITAVRLRKERSVVKKKTVDSKDGLTIQEINACQIESASEYNLANMITNLTNRPITSLVETEYKSYLTDNEGNKLLRNGRPIKVFDKTKIKNLILSSCRENVIPLLNFRFSDRDPRLIQKTLSNYVNVAEHYPFAISIGNVKKLHSVSEECKSALREMDSLLERISGIERKQLGEEVNQESNYKPIKIIKGERLISSKADFMGRGFKTLALDMSYRNKLNVSALILLRDELKMKTYLEYHNELGNKVLYPFSFLRKKGNIPEHLRDIYEQEFKEIMEMHEAKLFQGKLSEVQDNMFEGENVKCMTKTPDSYSEHIFKLLYSTDPLKMYLNKYMMNDMAVGIRDYMLQVIAEFTEIFLRIKEDNEQYNTGLGKDTWLFNPKYMSDTSIEIKNDFIDLAKKVNIFPERITNMGNLSVFNIVNNFAGLDTTNITYFGEENYIQAVDDIIEGVSARIDVYRTRLKTDENLSSEDRMMLEEIVNCRDGIPFNKLHYLTFPIFDLEKGHIDVLERLYKIAGNLMTIKEITRNDSSYFEDVDYELTEFDVITVKLLNQIMENRIKKFEKGFNRAIYNSTEISDMYSRLYKTTVEFNAVIKSIKEYADFVEPNVKLPHYRGIDDSVNDFITMYYDARGFKSYEELCNEPPDENVKVFIAQHKGFGFSSQMNYVVDADNNPVYIRHKDRNWVIYKTGKIITERLADFNTYESRTDIWNLDIPSAQFLEKHREEFINWHMN